MLLVPPEDDPLEEGDPLDDEPFDDPLLEDDPELEDELDPPLFWLLPLDEELVELPVEELDWLFDGVADGAALLPEVVCPLLGWLLGAEAVKLFPAAG